MLAVLLLVIISFKFLTDLIILEVLLDNTNDCYVERQNSSQNISSFLMSRNSQNQKSESLRRINQLESGLHNISVLGVISFCSYFFEILQLLALYLETKKEGFSCEKLYQNTPQYISILVISLSVFSSNLLLFFILYQYFVQIKVISKLHDSSKYNKGI